MKRLALALSLVMIAVLFAPTPSAAQTDEPEWWVDETTLPFEAVEGFEDSERMWGVHRGAGYRIEVPDNWNGDLIMWTHGYRGEDSRLFFNTDEFNPGFREWMLSEGYAWAASTYTKNSYNVTAGARDTRRLQRQFKKLVKRPHNTYIAGYSMGGHIAAYSAERYGHVYDGAVPMCGVTGDYELFDYFLDVGVAGQQLGLGTSQVPADPSFLFTQVPEIKENLGLSSPFPFAPFELTESGEQFKQLVELRSGGDRPNFDEAFTFWFTIDGASGPGNFVWELGAGDGTVAGGNKVVIDNTDVVYQVDLDPEISHFEAQLNKDIARIKRHPRASSRRGLRNPPRITGKLRMPVLSIHNLGDLFVPWHNEIEYANDTASRGKSHRLVQRAIRGVSHCGFTDAEMIEAVSDLIDWAETGKRPAGDNLLDPAVLADPNLGCTFTRNDGDGHVFATPCP